MGGIEEFKKCRNRSAVFGVGRADWRSLNQETIWQALMVEQGRLSAVQFSVAVA